MSRFRVLIADDEPLALELLRDLLERDPEVELIGACGDGKRALELIRTRRPDIAFLDIEMPERGGVEVVEALLPEELPTIVFVTAYSHHAPKAFEIEALDYVVKPFSDDRFFAALERAKRRVREQRVGELAGKMASLSAELDDRAQELGSVEKTAYLHRIRVATGDRSLILKPSEVVWIESCDYYARLHTARGSHLTRTSLASFEEQLDPRHFARVHRGAIVNLDCVTEVRRLIKGRRTLSLTDGSKLRVSRSRQKVVEERLAPRLGG